MRYVNKCWLLLTMLTGMAKVTWVTGVTEMSGVTWMPTDAIYVEN